MNPTGHKTALDDEIKRKEKRQSVEEYYGYSYQGYRAPITGIHGRQNANHKDLNRGFILENGKFITSLAFDLWRKQKLDY